MALYTKNHHLPDCSCCCKVQERAEYSHRAAGRPGADQGSAGAGLATPLRRRGETAVRAVRGAGQGAHTGQGRGTFLLSLFYYAVMMVTLKLFIRFEVGKLATLVLVLVQI